MVLMLFKNSACHVDLQNVDIFVVLCSGSDMYKSSHKEVDLQNVDFLRRGSSTQWC